MLGRRQLRAKAMQSIYSYYRSGDEIRKIERNMLREIEEIQNLYYYLLNLLKEVQVQAERKIETGLQKNLPTKEEQNPNYKFVNNQVFKYLNENPTLTEFSEDHKEFTWGAEMYPSKIFKSIVESKSYDNYMNSGTSTLEEDKKYLLKFFEKHIATNEELTDFLEDKRLHWADDLHIANTMVFNTIKGLTEETINDTPLLSLVKEQEHIDFTVDIFRKTIAHENELTELIDQKAKNWELERIALLDRIVLQMALCEMLYFPNIPPKVTINEYVEIAKAYSTPNSKVFVNGILDKTLKELKEENKLNKFGRGLL